jgi:hypothetical protein
VKIEGDPHWRNYLVIGRDVFHKHPNRFDEAEWDEAREFVALNILEQEETADGGDGDEVIDGLPGE